jgi:hypothetical protein
MALIRLLHQNIGADLDFQHAQIRRDAFHGPLRFDNLLLFGYRLVPGRLSALSGDRNFPRLSLCYVLAFIGLARYSTAGAILGNVPTGLRSVETSQLRKIGA